MDDLVAFVTARLDEDEAVATAAYGDGSSAFSVRWADNGRWALRDHPGGSVMIRDGNGAPVVYDEGSPTEAEAAHIARHDPARALREVHAMRMILARYADTLARMEDDNYPGGVARDQGREYEDFVLPELAAAWNDHPDYRQEWQP